MMAYLIPEHDLFLQEIYTVRGESCTTVSSTEAESQPHVSFLHHKLLKCDSSGLEYTIEDHDITLRVPAGAVAENQTIDFETGVTLYGPFVFPPNTQPISPIIWLCALDVVQLQKPFRLLVPHVLVGLTKDRLQHHQVEFAKAIHNDYTAHSGQIKYKFKSCESKPLFASSGSKSYAVVESTHFCYNCIVGKVTPKLARDAGYCLVRIERPSVSFKRDEVYFTAVYFLNTCINVISITIVLTSSY